MAISQDRRVVTSIESDLHKRKRSQSVGPAEVNTSTLTETGLPGSQSPKKKKKMSRRTEDAFNRLFKNLPTGNEWRKRQLELGLDTNKKYEEVVTNIRLVVSKKEDVARVVESFSSDLRKSLKRFSDLILLSYCQCLREWKFDYKGFMGSFKEKEWSPLLDTIQSVNKLIVDLIEKGWSLHRATEFFFLSDISHSDMLRLRNCSEYIQRELTDKFLECSYDTCLTPSYSFPGLVASVFELNQSSVYRALGYIIPDQPLPLDGIYKVHPAQSSGLLEFKIVNQENFDTSSNQMRRRQQSKKTCAANTLVIQHFGGFPRNTRGPSLSSNRAGDSSTIDHFGTSLHSSSQKESNITAVAAIVPNLLEDKYRETSDSECRTEAEFTRMAIEAVGDPSQKKQNHRFVSSYYGTEASANTHEGESLALATVPRTNVNSNVEMRFQNREGFSTFWLDNVSFLNRLGLANATTTSYQARLLHDDQRDGRPGEAATSAPIEVQTQPNQPDQWPSPSANTPQSLPPPSELRQEANWSQSDLHGGSLSESPSDTNSSLVRIPKERELNVSLLSNNTSTPDRQSPVRAVSQFGYYILSLEESFFNNITLYFEKSCRDMIFDKDGALVTRSGAKLLNSLCNDFDSYCFTATIFKEKKMKIEFRNTLSKAYTLVEQILQAEHPRTLACFFEVLIHLIQNGLLQEAIFLCAYIKNVSAKVTGKEYAWGQICRLLGELDENTLPEALSVAWGCIADIFERKLGISSPLAVSVRLDFIKRVYGVTDALVEEDLLLRLFENCKTEPQFPIPRVMLNLAHNLNKQRRYNEAKEMASKVYSLLSTETYADRTVKRIESLKIISRSYFEQKDIEQAERALRQAIDIIMDEWGEQHPWVLEFMNVIEGWLRSSGKEDEADTLKQQIADLMRG